jgi:glycosyltransferase involved in cell wall biosynthesis
MAEPNARPPRVSVIAIFWNAADYLAEAIESVLAQSYRDFELLLVDDGSTDSSKAIGERYAAADAERVRLLEFPGRANRGRSAARNLGIQHARGEFVAFIDADDRWRATKLQGQLELFETFPEVDAVCGAVNYWRSWNGGDDQIVLTGDVQNQLVMPPSALLSWYPLGDAHAPSMSDLLIRTASVRAVNAFEDEFHGAYDDQAFLAKFYLHSTIYVSSTVWSDYRLHDGSCMATLMREGGYHDIRHRFLLWFGDYLARRPEAQSPIVTAALRRALFPYDHPLAAVPGRIGRKVLRTFAGK